MMKAPRSIRIVGVLAAAVFMAVGVTPARAADDAAGLDLTMQVLGKDDKVDDGLVNHILIPGVGAAAAERAKGAAEARRASREENRESRRERREDAVERYRERRDRPD